MNVGIFTDVYYPFINGVVSSTKILENELRKQGHKVFIFAPKDPKAKDCEEENVYRLSSLPLFFFPSLRLSGVFSLKYFLMIRKLKLDVIHTQTEFALPAFGRTVSKILKIPNVHTYHTLYEEYVHYIAKGHFITPQMARDYSRIYCNAANAVITPSSKGEMLLKNYGVTKKIYVIPNGINLEPFKKENYSQETVDQLKEELKIAPDTKVILFVGRVAREKSLDMIINQMPNIIQKIPEARLVVIGNGPALKELTELTEKINMSEYVTFAGERPWAYIGKYYRVGDVFISASVTETQGLTYVEAMAASIPVVAKKDKSLQNLITDKYNGCFFENIDELPDVLFNLLSNKQLYKMIINNALQTTQAYSGQQFAKKVEVVYNTVIDEHSSKCKLKFFTRLKRRIK